MSPRKAYEEIVEFIAAGTTPETVVAFRPSVEARERIAELIHREKTSGVDLEEKAELDLCMQLEHIMVLARARARQHIADADLMTE